MSSSSDLNNGATFRSQPVNVDPSFLTEFPSDSKIQWYSYGDVFSHHGTVLRAVSNEKITFKVNMTANSENPLEKILTVTIARDRWDPKEATVNTGPPTSPKTIVNHTEQACKDFGKYEYCLNNCQTWNNRFIRLFQCRRETLADRMITFGRIFALATGMGIVVWCLSRQDSDDVDR